MLGKWGESEQETSEPISIYYLYYYSTSVPSWGPESHPSSTVKTQSQTTVVPAPEGLQSPFPNRGTKEMEGVKGSSVKMLITVMESVDLLLRTISF